MLINSQDRFTGRSRGFPGCGALVRFCWYFTPNITKIVGWVFTLGQNPLWEDCGRSQYSPRLLSWIEGVAFHYFLTTKYLAINQISLSENDPKLLSLMKSSVHWSNNSLTPYHFSFVIIFGESSCQKPFGSLNRSHQLHSRLRSHQLHSRLRSHQLHSRLRSYLFTLQEFREDLWGLTSTEWSRVDALNIDCCFQYTLLYYLFSDSNILHGTDVSNGLTEQHC